MSFAYNAVSDVLGLDSFAGGLNDFYAGLAVAEKKRQQSITAAGNTLAAGSTEVLSNPNNDFVALGLADKGLAQSYNARRDTILQARAMPGRAQTILANGIQRL